MHITRPDRLAAALLAVVLVAPGLALADDATPAAPVTAVRDQWAQIIYVTPKAQRASAFDALARQAAQVVAERPQDPDALIWDGIVRSSLAGERGGLGALSLARQARRDFESALALDPTALDGAAHVSLGALYDQVPGWPIGFGDDAKARTHLQRALELAPADIDANYFYGEFLRGQGDLAGAAAAFERAIAAPARSGRETADRGRREDATQKLADVRARLASR
ncbi:hypothetical protein [Luteimonas abyssi]|uniref:hypothetical protein n=1 Tax=Luteimonas abyssi TaxID=1247514 RepID=UPI000737D0C8|nr:hypothetical protein [Luteimonas abyssi]